jgi:hypothetical protein
MGQFVVMGAMLKCSFGVAPSSMIVLPVNRVMIGNMPAANIMDFAPMVNILPFGMCQTPSNPMVAAATAAALGVLTPMPCIPVTVAPWTPGNPKTLVGAMPAVTNSSNLMCTWGGVINVTAPGQFTAMT